MVHHFIRWLVIAALSAATYAFQGCSVCGDGKEVTNLEAVFEFPGFPPVDCGTLQIAGEGGLVPLDQCGFLPSLIGVCECQPIGPETDGSQFVTPQPSPQPSLAPIASSGCSVCGDGKKVSNAEAIFAFPGNPSVECGTLEIAGETGLIPLDQCIFLPPLIGVCGCQPIGIPASSPQPTHAPTPGPTPPPTTASPTSAPPTNPPTNLPTLEPTEATDAPVSNAPVTAPVSARPTPGPTLLPTFQPTDEPILEIPIFTAPPTSAPIPNTRNPTLEPTTLSPVFVLNTQAPVTATLNPTTRRPTPSPTRPPTPSPTRRPTLSPTDEGDDDKATCLCLDGTVVGRDRNGDCKFNECPSLDDDDDDDDGDDDDDESNSPILCTCPNGLIVERDEKGNCKLNQCSNNANNGKCKCKNGKTVGRNKHGDCKFEHCKIVGKKGNRRLN